MPLCSRLPMTLVPLYADAALVAVDKPPGLPAVPGRTAQLQDCMASRVGLQWPDALVVHRLDMPTSGLMLFARGPEVQRRLSMDFAARRIDKHYVALVHGRMAADSGRVELPLMADWPRRPRQKVDPQQGKPASTDWRVLDFDATRQVTRLALRPHTGRTHQLRVHLAAIGHPIVGDALYAAPEVQQEGSRMYLHACALELAHPVDAGRLSLRCPAPF